MNASIYQPSQTLEECTATVNQIRDALYVLNGKWKLPLIFTLTESPKRFGELQKVLEGITARTLTKELKELEANEFLIRKVQATTPVTIIYEATSYSDSLQPVLYELRDWGARHREKIKQSIRRSGIAQS
jgi:DNA-binding HxlR family transcriptional regulator